MEDKSIFWLRQIKQIDCVLTGSKAANLGELIRSGIQVPDGFCVSNQEYKRLVGEDQALFNLIQNELAAIDFDEFENLKAHAAAIRPAIHKVSLRPELEAGIRQAYQRLAEQSGSNFVAIRSSSSAEDRQNASGAGQQDTLLNVSGIENVLEGIKICWASLWNERAIAYRQANGFSQFEASIAVLVQSMVSSNFAGVMFTRHPLTGADQIVIDATWGQGEGVVDGTVNPEEIVLDGVSLAEIEFRPGDKNQSLLADPIGAGTLTNMPNPVPSTGRCLAPAQARALAEIGKKIEVSFGQPQDIEWATAEGQIYILQSRPVTTLPTPASDSFFSDPIRDKDSIWTSAFFIERFPHPVSPLGWSLIKDPIIDAAIREPLRFTGTNKFDNSWLFRLYRGRPFINVQAYQKMFKHFPEALMPVDAPNFFPDRNTAIRKEVDQPRFVSFLFSLVKTLTRSLDWTPWNYKIWNQFAVDFSRNVTQISDEIERKDFITIRTLLERIDMLNQLSRKLLSLHRWSMVYANVLMALLQRYVRAWTKLDHPDEVSLNLVGGLSNLTTRLDSELWKLAKVAKPLDPAEKRLFACANEVEVAQYSEQPKFTTGIEFRKRFLAFIKKYGHRSTSLDILYPPYESDKAQVLELIQIKENANEVSPDEKVDQRRQKREAETKRMRQILTCNWFERLFPLRWIYFRTGLMFTQIYMQLREEQRFYFQMGLAGQRKAFLKIAEAFVSQGILTSLTGQTDIFYLTIPEIHAAADGTLKSDELQHRISARKDEFSRIQRMGYPAFLRGDLNLEDNSFGPSAGQGSVLRGIPISTGSAQGRARVITSPENLDKMFSRINQGDILITTATDPGWTPIFSKLGGLVMETGGQLSHGAVVAHEYGIPAVAGITGAASIIKDGDVVTVNGSDGLVIRA